MNESEPILVDVDRNDDFDSRIATRESRIRFTVYVRILSGNAQILMALFQVSTNLSCQKRIGSILSRLRRLERNKGSQIAELPWSLLYQCKSTLSCSQQQPPISVSKRTPRLHKYPLFIVVCGHMWMGAILSFMYCKLRQLMYSKLPPLLSASTC